MSGGSPPETDLVLIDSSVWIPLLRRGNRSETLVLREVVDALLAADAVAITGVIRLELLVGTRGSVSFEELRSPLLGLHSLPTLESDWDDAGQLGQRLRLAGLVAQNADLLTTTSPLRTGVTLLHRDDDFERIAQHSSLRTERHL